MSRLILSWLLTLLQSFYICLKSIKNIYLYKAFFERLNCLQGIKKSELAEKAIKLQNKYQCN